MGITGKILVPFVFFYSPVTLRCGPEFLHGDVQGHTTTEQQLAAGSVLRIYRQTYQQQVEPSGFAIISSKETKKSSTLASPTNY